MGTTGVINNKRLLYYPLHWGGRVILIMSY
nr:MAG TPA: hypothetical protein [Caudoviricetes sp.]